MNNKIKGTIIYLLKTKDKLTDAERALLIQAYLPNEEVQAAASINDADKSSLSIQSHAFKRFVLSLLYDIPPKSISFDTTSYGKPFIRQHKDDDRIYFNLSHTTGLTAMIVSDEGEVGIDVERVNSRDDIELLELVIYHENELEEAKGLESKQRTENFFLKWTVKESLLKAMGTGLMIEPVLLYVQAKDGRATVSAESVKEVHLFTTQYFRIEDYALAYSVVTSASTNLHPIFTYRFTPRGFEKA